MTPSVRSRSTLVAAALGAVLASGCSPGDSDSDARPDARPDARSTSSGDPSPTGPAVRATRLAEVADEDGNLRPGPYALGFAEDGAGLPFVVVDVPKGYVGRGDGFEILAEKGGFRHLDTWTVSEVAEEPCGAPTWTDPGPGVDDLADALAALPVWESTDPVPTRIDGHDGVYLELYVPRQLPEDCQGGPWGWREESGGTQGVGPGKMHHLWIVDVDGTRVMLVVGFFTGVDQPLGKVVAEMDTMVGTATFVDEAQLQD